MRLVDGAALVDQSTLTGESIPVEKAIDEEIYAGSFVAHGLAEGEVTKTGPLTYFGRTAQLLQSGKAKLAIETITMSIMKYLMVLDIIFIVIVATEFLVLGIPLITILPLLLVLLIASIPVALPTMSTVALALGAVELADQGVIVRKLNAVESAAMMDVTCLDKTGTITENKLSIIEVIPFEERYSIEEVIGLAVLASDPISADPIDAAIIRYAKNIPDTQNLPYELVDFKPFDPSVKRAEATVRNDGENVLIMKGAPQILAAEASNVEEQAFTQTISQLAEKGYRTLAISVRTQDVVELIGLLAIQDRVRPDSADLIAKLKEQGIAVKMITGDNFAVAQTIAKEVGLGDSMMRIKELGDIHRPGTHQIIDATDVFAEVTPEDKYNIIDVLQTAGHHVVGMTGDGVNDAPALSRAQVGIAVSNATDVARSSAQILLSRPGIQNIVDLVSTGRGIYRKIIIWILNKIIKTFQIVFFVSLATIVLKLQVITSIQMLLILFLFDFVTISISADKVQASDKPEKWNLRQMIGLPSLLGSINVAESFLALALAMYVFEVPTGALQTFVFYQIFLSGLLNIFSVRETRHFWSSRPRTILWGIITCDIIVGTIIVLSGALMTPLAPLLVIVLIGFELVTILGLNDAVKFLVNKRKGVQAHA
jgi:H+-transporting ATPase